MSSDDKRLTETIVCIIIQQQNIYREKKYALDDLMMSSTKRNLGGRYIRPILRSVQSLYKMESEVKYYREL